jgi:hypothetical protein
MFEITGRILKTEKVKILSVSKRVIEQKDQNKLIYQADD